MAFSTHLFSGVNKNEVPKGTRYKVPNGFNKISYAIGKKYFKEVELL